jgi:hypothetical protein
VNNSTVIAALIAAKNRYPKQRICQIIFNALDKQGKARFPNGMPSDLFYVTDQDLADALYKYER